MTDPLSTSYHHTQIGYGMLVMLAVGLLITAGVAAIAAHTVPPGSSRTVALLIDGAVALLVLAAAVIFSSLTIDVRGGLLSWHFTGNAIRGSVDVGDIIDAQAVRDSPGYGWGIRETPEGRLYNVSGLGAVRVTLRDGRRISFGTNEPDRLAAAIAPLGR